jgi:hypothetical protein
LRRTLDPVVTATCVVTLCAPVAAAVAVATGALWTLVGRGVVALWRRYRQIHHDRGAACARAHRARVDRRDQVSCGPTRY